MSTASLVVPSMEETMTLSSPSIAFTKDDFTTFGLPMIANEIDLSSLEPISSSLGNLEQTSSNKSPIPIPWIAEITKGSPNPNE